MGAKNPFLGMKCWSPVKCHLVWITRWIFRVSSFMMLYHDCDILGWIESFHFLNSYLERQVSFHSLTYEGVCICTCALRWHYINYAVPCKLIQKSESQFHNTFMIVIWYCLHQEKPQPSLREPAEEHEYSHWLNFNGNNVRNCMISSALFANWHGNFQHLVNSY